MRRTLAILLIALFFVPGLPARGQYDWNNVTKLKHGTRVAITLWNGDDLSGRIDSVGDASLRLAVPDPTNPQGSWIHTIDRTGIQRIVRVVPPPKLPDPAKAAVVGAVAGGAIGVTSGAISDAKNGYQGRWVLGGFFGALGGATVGVMTAAVIGIAQFPSALAHHTTLIYEDPRASVVPTMMRQP